MNIEPLYQYFINSSGVCTDTRKVTKDCLFFALKGPTYNGNAFAEEALEKGAYRVIVDEPTYNTTNGNTILVDNSLKALQKLAAHHRKSLGLPIIALTGSNGKTTTKELIFAVLSQKFRTEATQGNLNNHIGVPLTLLKMTSKTEIGIVEMGANHPREIEMLCEIAHPDYGYITNFGKAHLEGFGNIEGVIKAKTELYDHLKKYKKSVFVNTDDPIQVLNSNGMKQITFGNEQQDCHVKLINASEIVIVGYKNTTIKSNLIGQYNYSNIAAAIAIGDHFKVSEKDIKKAIEAYFPSNNRSQLLEKGGNKIIMDAYNANPTSMMAALQNFKQANGTSKFLILGDMFEVGPESDEEHRLIVDYLEKNPFGTAYLVGKNFFKHKTPAFNIQQFETFEAFSEFLKEHPLHDAFILIKGSRGMALERVLDLL